VAVAASGAPALSRGRKASLFVKWGNFRGENAVGATAQVRLDDNIALSGSFGGGVRRGGLGGGAGGLLEW
jgi:hypothetical protein